MPGYPQKEQFRVIAAFMDRGESFDVAADGSSTSGRSTPFPKEPLSERAAAALESLLGTYLDDVRENTEIRLAFDDVPVDTRLGHAAARALADRLPDLYAYDPTAPSRARERMRHAALVKWRARRGMSAPPPLKLRPLPEPVPEADMAPLLDAVVGAREAAERAKAVAAIEAKGIGALPSVVSRLEGLPNESPVRAPLEACAARLASIVTEVSVGNDSDRLPARTAELLRGLRGAPLDEAGWLQLVLHVTRVMVKGRCWMYLRVVRQDDLGGITLQLSLKRRPLEPGSRLGGWKGSMGGSGGFWIADEGAKEASGWESQVAEVTRVVRSSPRTPIDLRFSLYRQVER